MKEKEKNEFTKRVVTAAANTGKVKKEKAMEVVEAMIEYASGHVLTGRPTADELATLYSFFLPPVPANPKTPEKWVAKALPGKDEVRTYLHPIHSTGTQLEATDGNRLHIYKFWVNFDGKYPVGFYNQKMAPVSCTIQYPDTTRVTPDTYHSHSIPLASLEVREIRGAFAYVIPIGGTHAGCSRYIEESEILLNREYVLQVTGKSSNITILNWGLLLATESVLLKGPFPDTVAVIMPMRDNS